MSQNIIGTSATVAAQYVNTHDDSVRYRTARAARNAIPADVRDAHTVVQMSTGADIGIRTMRRVLADPADVSTVLALPDRPIIADVRLSRIVFGHRVARGADWINSRPNTDEMRIASGGRTTADARASFDAMVADTAARLHVPADAIVAWIATDGATRNVPTDDALDAMRVQ